MKPIETPGEDTHTHTPADATRRPPSVNTKSKPTGKTFEFVCQILSLKVEVVCLFLGMRAHFRPIRQSIWVPFARVGGLAGGRGMKLLFVLRFPSKASRVAS